MKRFLSLVLTLVMVMSLVTVSAGAKDFTDNDVITYDEAVAVISEIGVVDGYAGGDFKPANTLTRQAAAKIICNLILGPTTAAELHADTAPYRDVPANSEFAGYIAYCQSRGIISGYADGSFRPGGTLTGYAFMKMLLGALGYDAALESYVGANWSINVAKQALGIGLNKGLVDEFNGIKAVTREEACLYAFNTLQADLVEYGQRLTTNINGTEVTLSSGGAKSRSWNSQQSRYDYIRNDNLIQFAEEYFNKLEKRKDRDMFERPAYTWIYDKEEIGTYVDWELLVERYTSGVSGRDLYDLLGAAAIKDNELVYYVNGRVPSDTHPMNSAAYASKKVDADSDIEKADLVRSNKDDVGITNNGVLTEVFLDKDGEVITITSIDTFLGKALADYSESKEYAPVEVYTGLTGTTENKKTTKTTWNVDVEDVKTVEDIREGDYKLVNITFKNEDKGEVVILNDPDIMEESAITKFSKTEKTVASKVTVGGTEYKASMRAFFSDDALNDYDQTLLTDKTYNVYMDRYGYFIGLELYEGAKNYVFITGFDRPTSNLSISTAKANGIFLDGTMQDITVNVKATNDNIAAANTKGTAAEAAGNAFDSYQYFTSWNDRNLPGIDGSYRYNRWFTYSVTADGVYTLKPCVRMTATKYTQDDTVIRTDNLYVDDNVYVEDAYLYHMDGHTADNGRSPTLPQYTATKNERSYGEDDTVFITVGLDESDTSGGARAITEVDGVYTGVQNIEIEIEDLIDAEEAQIYTVYDGDHYMIAAIAVGEAKGSGATLAYVISGAKSERLEDGIYYWEFDAILNGTKQTLTAKSKYDMFDANTKATIDAESVGGDMITGATSNLNDGLVEIRFDADEYVVDVKQIDEKDIYNFYGNRYPGTSTPALKGASSVTTGAAAPTGKRTTVPATEQLDLRDAKAYRMNVIRAAANDKGWVDARGVAHYYDSVPSELFLQGRTLYITTGQYDEGLALASDCRAIVIQKEYNKKDVLTEFASVETALKHIADKDKDTTALEFDGEVIAVMNDRGAAAWVVFKTDEELHAGTTSGGGQLPNATVINNGGGNFVVEFYDPNDGSRDDLDDTQIRSLIIQAMEKYTGMTVKSYNYPVNNNMVLDDGTTFGANATAAPRPMVKIMVDEKQVGGMVPAGTALSGTDLVGLLPDDGNYLVDKDTKATNPDYNLTAGTLTANGSTVAAGSMGSTQITANANVNIYTANVVTATAANSITYKDSGNATQTFNGGDYARKGLVLTLNKDADPANYQQWQDNAGDAFGPQAAPARDLSATYTVIGSGTEKLTVVTGKLVRLDGTNVGVIGSGTVDFQAPAGAKFVSEQSTVEASSDHFLAAQLINNATADAGKVNAGFGFWTYTYAAADDANSDGIIDLTSVVEVVMSANVHASYDFGSAPATTANIAKSTTVYVKAGTLLKVKAEASAASGENITLNTSTSGLTNAEESVNTTTPAKAEYAVTSSDIGVSLSFDKA